MAAAILARRAAKREVGIPEVPRPAGAYDKGVSWERRYGQE
jgi:hypothetical protein